MNMSVGYPTESQNSPTGEQSTTGNDLKSIAEIIAIMQQEQEKRDKLVFSTFEKCPGACADGLLHVKDAEGQRFSRSCHFKNAACAYGIAQKKRMKDFFYAAFAESQMPEIHREALYNVIQTPVIQAIKAWNCEEKSIMILLGGKGVGKSFAAARAFVDFIGRRTPPDLWNRPYDWARFAEDACGVLEWCHIYALSNDRDELDRAVKATFLVLDDLSTEDATPAAVSRINYLINARYEKKRPTVITGNAGLEDFIARYGDRVFDRLKQSAYIVTCKGENLRDVKSKTKSA